MITYSDRFNKFLPFIYQWECVYSKGHYGDLKYVISENEANDPGGVTKFGIDKRSHPNVDIVNLTESKAREIYWNEYWSKYKCQDYPDKKGECVMNCAVNAGYGRAKLILLKAKTAAEFIEEQRAFYYRLVDAKPSFKKFLKGWLARTADLKKFLKL